MDGDTSPEDVGSVIEQYREPEPYAWPRVVGLAILGASVTCLVGVLLFLVPRPNPNRLALGDQATLAAVDIALQPPIELDYKTREEVLLLRRGAVEQHPDLLLGDYRPSDAVFGQVEDRLPWWGLLGQVYYGPGAQSIAGLSEESRFLLNPFLLVAPDFYHDWRGMSESVVTRPGFELFCPPLELRWVPAARRGEATYHADCVASTNSRVFDLIAYNARDLNLGYVYVVYDQSRNVRKADAPAGAYAVPHYLHRGGSCGVPGGCNNMSPPSPEIDALEITGFPAFLVVRLWHEEPRDLSQPPDMLFILRFL